jgi:hypothetical protein
MGPKEGNKTHESKTKISRNLSTSMSQERLRDDVFLALVVSISGKRPFSDIQLDVVVSL